MGGRTRLGYRLLFPIAVAVCNPSPRLRAQTVWPVIVEYSGKARGKFELVNNGLRSINVVLEPKSFTVSEKGDGVFTPLAADIHLKLSAMSFRIPPRQSRFVFYEATADRLPAWFVIYSTFAEHAQSGLNINLQLPHTVYLLQKQSLEKADVQVQSLRYLAAEHRVTVTLANPSAKLGRVLEWQVTSKRTKTSNPGFPLLPGSQRRLETTWDAPDPPQALVIRFEHFTVKEEFSAGGP